jgi:hypothetical protein
MIATLLACMPASGATFTFEDFALFSTTPLSTESGTITATFSSPQGAVFFVAPGDVFSTLSGNILVDSDTEQNALDILFSSPLQRFSVLFALRTSSQVDELRLEALLEGVVTGSASAQGAIPPGLSFPEGSLSFSGAIFDQVRLTSSAEDFAIDNVEATPEFVPIPEPSSAWLGGAGLMGVMFLVARRPVSTK